MVLLSFRIRPDGWFPHMSLFWLDEKLSTHGRGFRILVPPATDTRMHTRFLIVVGFIPPSQSSRKNLLRRDAQRNGWDETLFFRNARLTTLVQHPTALCRAERHAICSKGEAKTTLPALVAIPHAVVLAAIAQSALDGPFASR